MSSFFIAAVEGYIHLLSSIKKAVNCGNTNYFDCKLQRSNHKSVCLVCYSPKKRERKKNLEEVYGLECLIKEPTRITENSSTLLDVIKHHV